MKRSLYWAAPVGFLLSSGTTVLAAPPLRGDGPPMPEPACDGSKQAYCSGGNLAYHCCPVGAKCNYRYEPYVQCGGRTCIPGSDPGRCPAPQPMTTGAKTESDCKAAHGSWEQACIGRKVTAACITPYHTNYSGPSHNPSFKSCGTSSCTTTAFIEDCYPKRSEATACSGAWTPICLGGKAEDRCVPPEQKPGELPAAKFVKCDDGGCAIGTSPSACNR